MKVFVSSVIKNYKKYRKAAKRGIEILGHEAVLVQSVATSSPPQRLCLEEVGNSDVVVMLLGARYGTPQESGKSATHEEFDHARGLGKQILVFIQDADEGWQRETEQEKFIAEIESWTDGLLCSYYTKHNELTIKVVEALRRLEEKKKIDPTATLDAADDLPPVCRERMANLRVSSHQTWKLLVGLLSDPVSRQPGVLSKLAGDPPDWLSEAGYEAWEAISDFIDAHDVGDSDKTRQLAIEAGSPRSGFYLIRQAMVAAVDEDTTRAHELLAQAPSDHPMMPIAQAYVEDDMRAVVQAVQTSGLLGSDDADLAIYSTLALLDAYNRLDRLELVERPLKAVIDRFPDRTHWLLSVLAEHRIRLAKSHRPWAEAENRSALRKAVDEALRSRDLLRTWQGPSHRAVAVAANALFQLQNFQRIVDIATIPPRGEAITSEADSPPVQIKLAYALLMLDRHSEVDTLGLDQLDDPEVLLLRAIQAHDPGDTTAVARIRRAVTQAADSNNESLLIQSLLYLAQCGEVDESAMTHIPDVHADLCRGVAALNREEPEEATLVLTPYRLESPLHADYLAKALNKTGELDEAIETLREAAEHFGAERLHQPKPRYSWSTAGLKKQRRQPSVHWPIVHCLWINSGCESN